ncbi:hypothetical protein ACYATM_06610 [Lactobacillaceae bacterium Scapto_B20]
MFQEGIFTKNTVILHATNPNKEKGVNYTFTNVNANANASKLETLALIVESVTGDKTQSITKNSRYEYELNIK